MSNVGFFIDSTLNEEFGFKDPSLTTKGKLCFIGEADADGIPYVLLLINGVAHETSDSN